MDFLKKYYKKCTCGSKIQKATESFSEAVELLKMQERERNVVQQF